MKWIFGLPAHPFFVHVPIILIPAVCICAIAIAARPGWRRRFGWIVVGASAVCVIAVQFAITSGEKFDELTGNSEPIEHHEDLARMSRLFVAALFVVVLALVLVGRARDQRSGATASVAWMPPLVTALAVVTIAAAVLSTVWIARTGHEGTKVVWRGLIENRDNDGG
jgi:hypothetical protein